MVFTKTMEIRGKEIKTNKKGEEFILARLEDTDTGESLEVVDNSVDRAEYYQRGKMAEFCFDLKMGKFWNLRIKDFKLVE